MKRQKGLMSDELFTKVVDDCQELDPKVIYPFFFGEPFLDKKIYSRMAYVRGRFPPSVETVLYSNLGLPINEAEVDKLSGSFVVISYTEGADQEVRSHNVDLLRAAGVTMEVHVVGEGTMMTPLVRQAHEFAFKHALSYTAFGKYNWAGKIQSRYKNPDGYCCRPRTQICVLWDGRVALCCMDGDGEVILGDARVQTLKQIWEGEKARMYREKKKSELDFCKSCNMPNMD